MEAVGLALGVLGISGLFTACIENFDIVVNARNFGPDFDLLCTQLSLQRVRLVLWGETLGLVPGPAGSRIRYNKSIDRADVRPAIEATLNHLCLLLQNADVVTGRYEVQDGKDGVADAQPASTGLTMFRERFESFKARIRKNQKTKSTWTVTRWAVHDSTRFRAIITNIKDLMDGLEGITSTLGVLERQQALLTEEVESISDTRSLLLLQEVASLDGTSASLRIVSDAASFRLSLTGSSVSLEASRSRVTVSSRSMSYHTAPSHQPRRTSLPVLGEESTTPEPSNSTQSRPPIPLAWAKFRQTTQNRLRKGTEPFYLLAENKQLEPREVASGDDRPGPAPSPFVEGVPQNQRLIASLMSNTPTKPPEQNFESGSLHYGEALTGVKRCDEETWKRRSTSLLVSADQGLSASRRVFLELRSIRNAGVPFISAAPVGDSLDKVLATIEGPPDTAYEGGIFWISVKFPDKPSEPPILRFQTRVYHPNIDPSGNICADYQQWWNDPNLHRYMSTMADGAKGSWFSGGTSDRYSLGALLTALCGLLACPNVEDPLVPEIAATYITDYDDFCRTAQLYTNKYATAQLPPMEIMMDFGNSVNWADIQRTIATQSTISPSTMETSLEESSRALTISTEDDASECHDVLKQASLPRFMPAGEGKELQRSKPSPNDQVPELQPLSTRGFLKRKAKLKSRKFPPPSMRAHTEPEPTNGDI